MRMQNEYFSELFYPSMSEVTEQGIKYGEKYYSCQAAIRKQWFHSSANERVLTVFVDTLNDDYLLIQLEDGCLAVAHQVEHQQINSDGKLNDYYELMNKLKKLIKERKRKRKK